MLDRLQQFKETASQHGIQVDLTAKLNDIEAEQNNDRELIKDFLDIVGTCQDQLNIAESNNNQMKQLASKSVHENKSSQQANTSKRVNEIIDNNNRIFTKIKSDLSLMNQDIEASVLNHPDEPETRVKKTIYKTFTHKFRDVIRNSQTIQTEFKNAVQSRMKR